MVRDEMQFSFLNGNLMVSASRSAHLPVVNYQTGDTHMLTKTKIVLATVLMLGTASAASAGTQGGFDIGPMGQCMNPPDCGGTHKASVNARHDYGFVQPATHHKHRSVR
jgi:hypothetical protein